MSINKNYDSEIQEVLTHLRSIGGPVPLHRKESKRPYSFSKWTFADQLAVWDMLWRNHGGFWIRLHAFFFLERYMKKDAQLREMWPVIVEWQNQVDDWGLCDSLSKIYTRVLEIMPEEVYAQLQLWNTDKDLWKRRQSVVSLLYYSRTKKSYLPYNQLETLISTLLTDKEYYVQKGVGWTLRELYNVYPAEALAFFKAHIKTLSSIHFSTAIEKMDIETVTQLKALRKIIQ